VLAISPRRLLWVLPDEVAKLGIDVRDANFGWRGSAHHSRVGTADQKWK